MTATKSNTPMHLIPHTTEEVYPFKFALENDPKKKLPVYGSLAEFLLEVTQKLAKIGISNDLRHCSLAEAGRAQPHIVDAAVDKTAILFCVDGKYWLRFELPKYGVAKKNIDNLDRRKFFDAGFYTLRPWAPPEDKVRKPPKREGDPLDEEEVVAMLKKDPSIRNSESIAIRAKWKPERATAFLRTAQALGKFKKKTKHSRSRTFVQISVRPSIDEMAKV